MLGHVDEADELIGRAHETTSNANAGIWISSFWAAFILLWQGDPIAAEHELRPAYDALKQMGEKSHFSSIAHALSHALYDQGRYEEAEQLTHECEEASRPNDVHSQIIWRSIRAKTLARKGEHQAAEQLAREAVAFAEKSDFLLAHADALTDLAEVLELQGKHERGGRGTSARLSICTSGKATHSQQIECAIGSPNSHARQHRPKSVLGTVELGRPKNNGCRSTGPSRAMPAGTPPTPQ